MIKKAKRVKELMTLSMLLTGGLSYPMFQKLNTKKLQHNLKRYFKKQTLDILNQMSPDDVFKLVKAFIIRG